MKSSPKLIALGRLQTRLEEARTALDFGELLNLTHWQVVDQDQPLPYFDQKITELRKALFKKATAQGLAYKNRSFHADPTVRQIEACFEQLKNVYKQTGKNPFADAHEANHYLVATGAGADPVVRSQAVSSFYAYVARINDRINAQNYPLQGAITSTK